VVSGNIDLTDLKYTEFTEKELSKLSLQAGDILLVRSNGSANLVARSAVVAENAAGYAYAGYLIRLRLKQETILPHFLQLFLHSPQTRAFIERQARSTSGVHNINSDEVKNLTLKLPSIEEQLEIIDKVDDIFSQIDALEAWCETELKRSNTLRQSILKSAFSGRLVPQDATDEPASELLKRIQAERSTSKPAAKRGRKSKNREAA
jgi:type I restriction enzyme S subunit